MTDTPQEQASQFDFGAAISQLFSQGGGRDFAIRLVLWASALMGVGIIFMAKPYMKMMEKFINGAWIANSNPNDGAAILDAYSGMGQYILPILLLSIVLWAVYVSAETALHKRALKNIDHGFFPLRFGMAELRVMGTQFIVYLIAMLALFVLEIIMIALFAGTVFAGKASIIFGLVVGLFAFVSLLALFIIPIYIGVRLAPGAAISVKENKFAPLAGWSITKGRTGYLFLAYLFLFVAGYIVMTIIQLTFMGMIFSENYMMTIMGYSEQNPQEIFAVVAEKMKQPKIIFALSIGAVLYFITSMIWWVSISGVGTYAVKWWDTDHMDAG